VKTLEGIFLVVVALPISGDVWAHEGHRHVNPVSKSGANSSENNGRTRALERINERYLSEVKPIFQKSCFDCHSDRTRFPWYYTLPWVKGMIDKDISEAKKHIDMTRDFPFQGQHGTPEDDLQAIEKEIREKKMPPFRYRLIHPGSGINGEERDAVFRWIRDTRRDLEGAEASSR
jgi:hypothetical protein